MGTLRATSDAQKRRAHLRKLAAEAMDQDAADILIDQLPPAAWAWSDLVTKDDLDGRFAHHQELLDKRFELSEERTGRQMERGFRRQTMWIFGVLLAQSVALTNLLG